MKLAVFFGVYEAEKDFAHQTLGQLLEILQQHDVHVFVLDDASASRIGEALAQAYAGRNQVSFEVVRIEKSSGFRGAMDRTLFAFRHLASTAQDYDYILRVDADLFFNRKELARLFESDRLPKTGMVGTFTRFRARDYVQLFMDLLPFGFRRRKVDGVIEHKWEFSRSKPVWWWDLGFRAFWNGFDCTFVGGPFQIVSGQTLAELSAKGWLDRQPLLGLGLVFGEDVMSNILVKALNHPLTDIASLVADWSCDMAYNPRKGDWQEIQAQGYYLVHPLKGDAWAMQVRRQLEMLQSV